MMNTSAVPRRCSRLLHLILPLLLWASFGCSADKAPRKGEIMLALQTDMSIPEDVSHVRILVFKNGALKFDQKYRVGPDGEEIPATLGLLASDNPEDTTEVRVLSYQVAKVRTLNRVVTTIPQDRVATLRIPIHWLCDGQVVPTEGIPDSYDSSCANPDESCIAGECRKVKVSSTALPDFKIEDITGGSADAAHGVCFDTAPCFDEGRDVEPDADCRLTVPASAADALNIGLRLKPGQAGICSDSGACYIPFDKSDSTGWRVLEQNGSSLQVQLPSAACDRLQTGVAKAVRITTACKTKTEVNPTCGPWTSVGTQNPENKPKPGSGLDPDGGAGGTGSGSGSTEAGAGGVPGVHGGTGISGDGGGGDAGVHSGVAGASGDPSSECTGLADRGASGPIARDPEVDRFARLALEFDDAVARVRADLQNSCSGIVLALSGADSGSNAAGTTGETELEPLCANATTLFSARRQDARAQFGSAYCRANTAEQLTLEAACSKASGCSFGSLPDRCNDKLIGSCSACSGECTPGETMLSVSCDGTCLGQCVGSCDSACYGPQNNPLEMSHCMGECTGTCTGTCQGTCITAASCDGICRGGCEDSSGETACEQPLTVPDCALDGACANLAAATAGIRQSCFAPSIFVSSATSPTIGSVISGNFPRILQANQQGNGLLRATSYLQSAWGPLASSVGGNDAVCLAQARLMVMQASSLLDSALASARSLTLLLAEPQASPVCTFFPSDDSCTSCTKSNCCSALQACAGSSICQTETTCVKRCSAQGTAPAICQEQCATGGKLDSTTNAVLDCQSQRCSSCTPTSTACIGIDSSGLLVDNFDDGDVFNSFGSYRLTTSGGSFAGSLNTITPGSGDVGSALGAAGSPDPGISLDLLSCMDATQTSGISFDLAALGSTTPVTIRVRTRSTETTDRGGACTTQCGDHFAYTVFPDGGGFIPKDLAWSQFLNSGSNPPETNEIVGLDFVVFSSMTTQVAIDNLRFTPLFK